MKNYCGNPDHDYGCSCTKEAQLLMEKHMQALPKQTTPDNLHKMFDDLNDIDYNIRRKVIYKGKMANPGNVFIVVTKKGKSNKYEAWKQIPGNQSVEFEIQIAQQLRQTISDKYQV